MFRAMMGAAAAAAMLAAPLQAQAQPGCWKADEAAAANVRQLQSMLMVAALRCQVSGHTIMADYNAFVVANKTAIASQNDRLKAHFIRAQGPVAGQRGYDAFTTSMANGYGAGASGADACAEIDAVAREAALMAGSTEGLLLIAERQGLSATLAEGVCDAAPAVTIAANDTPAVPAPIQIAARP